MMFFNKDFRTLNDFNVKEILRNKQEDFDKFCDEDLLFITKKFLVSEDCILNKIKKKIVDLCD
jgi:hypothetical protein